MDHADVVRRVILAPYQVACANVTGLQGTDMVLGFEEVDEDSTIELTRTSALRGKVGDYRTESFFGKVNHMCLGSIITGTIPSYEKPGLPTRHIIHELS